VRISASPLKMKTEKPGIRRLFLRSLGERNGILSSATELRNRLLLRALGGDSLPVGVVACSASGGERPLIEPGERTPPQLRHDLEHA